MRNDTVLKDFDTLPPEAQKQVRDFIAFLQTRYQTPVAKRKTKPSPKLAEEAFIGIWRDRSDLQDSSAWVRKTRTPHSR